ncbi:ZIP family metal transporter [Olivibacter sp. SDN3]|uniref:ZIP family metal transporter n=1 Tax=Olivibacter sp. SDN3 TaxID=2764720 RepID=UPI001650DF3B|nr:ZIP family metal transporter [Olivibacter sp. SDN3]QNL52651.1 ZIP family metal transporter [Olivibacter sp. SDN3]
MTIGIIVVLFFSAFLGGISVFFVKRDNTNLLKLILSFSGAYLFSITVLHLIPEVYSVDTSEHIGIYVLIGFLFQLLLEQFSEGIEHGHIHKHNHQNNKFPTGVMISLCVHAFLEGVPLTKGPQKELLFGIAIHHIPAAFALGSLLIQTSLKNRTLIIALFIFALMSPLGFILSNTISNGGIGDIEQYFDKIMAIVIGIFLHISTTILFESSSADHHHFNRKKVIAVLLGIGASTLNFLFH